MQRAPCHARPLAGGARSGVDRTRGDRVERMGMRKGRGMLHGRRRWLGWAIPPPAALAACGNNGATIAGGHRLVVPNVVGLSQGVATRSLTHAGLTVGVISGIPAPRAPAGRVVATNPSPGEPVASGSVVSLTVSSGGSAAAGSVPTTPADVSSCTSGPVAYTESAATGFACVTAGSTLNVTFVSFGGWSGHGTWSRSPPTISDNSILRGRTYRVSARRPRRCSARSKPAPRR